MGFWGGLALGAILTVTVNGFAWGVVWLAEHADDGRDGE